MIPLGLCSAVALAILAERLWFLQRTVRETNRPVRVLGSGQAGVRERRCQC